MPVDSIRFVIERIATDLGGMLVVTDEQQRLRALGWDDFEERLQRQLNTRYGTRLTLQSGATPVSIRQALLAYLAGAVDAIDSIPVETGGTAFQRAVWDELRRIPAGTTLSYGQFAARIGKASAVRAVGHANGANPICIVVPCHRLVGSDGDLTAYGGGLLRKRWLLNHEAGARRNPI